MEVGVTYGLWTLVFLLGCGRVSAFNLDTDNVLRRNGEKGSLFGFSMAMHWQLYPDNKKMLLVGAPQAKKWLNQESDVTGGLYQCDISSRSTSCDRVRFDGDEDTKTESKENQWMGVTVNSQGPGGKIVTCAHRYQRRANVGKNLESRDIIGRCYVLSQSLTIDRGLDEEGGNWHFCDSRPRGHEMFGSCQQGLSATFDKDYHYIIFGAPGAYNWKGVVRLEQKNETLINLEIYDDGPFEAGGENVRNPNKVPSPSNSYMGFSLDSAKRLTGNDLTVVAGAPRANHSGAVFLLKKGEDNDILLEYFLEGEGLASSFGYDLTVLDLNADGWQDIVVGAPQYFEKDGEIGGAIYVYVNNKGQWNTIKPTRIDGPINSMFGLAVENLGDMNLDGYHDFAVGAPYEENGGKVYIYHGGAKGLRSTKPAQVLSPPSGVKLFGYSLAGNMDLDGNTYPDLAVGSLSDSVFIYKTRPVVNIEKEIIFSQNKIDLTQKNCGDTFCLDFEACFTYTANTKGKAPSLTITYSLDVDADLKKKNLITRATFSGNKKEVTGTMKIGNNERKCIKEKLVMKQEIKDKLQGIPIDVSVDIQGANRKRRESSTQLAPVLDDNKPSKIRKEVDFLKEGCGSDDICESKLQVKYRYVQKSKDDKDLFRPLELENGMPVISLNDQEIALEVTVSNPGGDDAHEAFLNVSFPSSLTYSGYRIPPNELPVSLLPFKNGSGVDCELGNPFKGDSMTKFYIILGTSAISLDTTEVEINLHLQTTSKQNLTDVKAKAKVNIELKMFVSGQAQPSQVTFGGEVKVESDMKTESDIGNAIAYRFSIINRGKSLKDVGAATLDIHWPQATENGRLLYLMNISSTGVDHMMCSPDIVNPLKIKHSNTRRKRAVADAQTSKEGQLSRLLDGNKVKILTCGGGAKCETITCPLRGFDTNAVITLYARLWDSTFISDYSKHHHVEVKVDASLRVDSGSKNIVVKNKDVQLKLMVFPKRSAARSGGVPWWIIVLSILFGLMLLALLAFLLWKCGVFNKKNKEDPSEKEGLTSNA